VTSPNDTDLEMAEAVERAADHADYWTAPHAFRWAHCHGAAGGFTGWDDEYLCEPYFRKQEVG